MVVVDDGGGGGGPDILVYPMLRCPRGCCDARLSFWIGSSGLSFRPWVGQSVSQSVTQPVSHSASQCDSLLHRSFG